MEIQIQKYSHVAEQTKKIQTIIQVEIVVNESEFGDSRVMLAKRLTRTKSDVIKSPILPGTTSGGITKLT